jgi:hypothetical protein
MLGQVRKFAVVQLHIRFRELFGGERVKNMTDRSRVFNANLFSAGIPPAALLAAFLLVSSSLRAEESIVNAAYPQPYSRINNVRVYPYPGGQKGGGFAEGGGGNSIDRIYLGDINSPKASNPSLDVPYVPAIPAGISYGIYKAAGDLVLMTRNPKSGSIEFAKPVRLLNNTVLGGFCKWFMAGNMSDTQVQCPAANGEVWTPLGMGDTLLNGSSIEYMPYTKYGAVLCCRFPVVDISTPTVGLLTDSCVPYTETQLFACPGGVSGSITKAKEWTCDAAGNKVEGPWVLLPDTNQCKCRLDAPVITYPACPPSDLKGAGGISKIAIYTCNGSGEKLGLPKDASETCLAPPPNPPCTPLEPRTIIMNCCPGFVGSVKMQMTSYCANGVPQIKLTRIGGSCKMGGSGTCYIAHCPGPYHIGNCAYGGWCYTSCTNPS